MKQYPDTSSRALRISFKAITVTDTDHLSMSTLVDQMPAHALATDMHATDVPH